MRDLHASLVSTDLPILTAPVVVDDALAPEESARLLRRLQECVAEHFPVSIEHATFQVEAASHGGEGAAHS